MLADLIKTEIKPEPEEENPDGGAIVLNATAEFCRSLGKFYSYHFVCNVIFSNILKF